MHVKDRFALLDEEDQLLLVVPNRIPIKTVEKYSGMKFKN